MGNPAIECCVGDTFSMHVVSVVCGWVRVSGVWVIPSACMLVSVVCGRVRVSGVSGVWVRVSGVWVIPSACMLVSVTPLCLRTCIHIRRFSSFWIRNMGLGKCLGRGLLAGKQRGGREGGGEEREKYEGNRR